MLGPCIITREFMNQVKQRGIDDAHVIFINRLLIMRPCMHACRYICSLADM